mgnify:CR=1 FL=1
MEVFPALSACSLFAGWTRDEIAAILPCLSARQAGFRRGQFLLRAGDEATGVGTEMLNGTTSSLHSNSVLGRISLGKRLTNGMLLCSALVLGGTAAVLSSTMPPFRDSVGDHNDTEKITGEYLVELSAAQD